MTDLALTLLAALDDSADGRTVAIGADEVRAAIELRDAGKVSLSGRAFGPDRVTLERRPLKRTPVRHSG